MDRKSNSDHQHQHRLVDRLTCVIDTGHTYMCVCACVCAAVEHRPFGAGIGVFFFVLAPLCAPKGLSPYTFGLPMTMSRFASGPFFLFEKISLTPIVFEAKRLLGNKYIAQRTEDGDHGIFAERARALSKEKKKRIIWLGRQANCGDPTTN